MTTLELLKNNKLSGRLTPEQGVEMYEEIKAQRQKYIDYLNIPSVEKRKMPKTEFMKIKSELNFFAQVSRLLLQNEISSQNNYSKIIKEISSKQQEALKIYKNHPETAFSHDELSSKYVISYPLNSNHFRVDAKPIFLILKEWFSEENEADIFMIYLSIRHDIKDREQVVKTYTYLEFQKSSKY